MTRRGGDRKLAFIFPGQGSQFVGMGRDLYDNFEAVRWIYSQADEILGFELKKLSFEGPEEKLKETRYTQPAIFVHSIAVSEILKSKGVEPSVVAGHSLGEYSALVTAGVLSFSDGLRLVKLRGELMHGAGGERPGTMAAVIGLSDEDVACVCDEARPIGVVQPANFNSPGQVVISGGVAAVREAMKLARDRGARRTLRLQVSGAFHSSLMESVSDKMEGVLRRTQMSPARIPVVANVTADFATDPEEIRRLLVRQITSPVRWAESMRKMVSWGVREMAEVGPGSVLQGLARRIDRTIDVVSVGDGESIEQFTHSSIEDPDIV